MAKKEFSWNDVSVLILGQTLEAFVGIEYETKTEKEYLRGRGNKPLAIQSGNKSYEGKLVVLQSTLQALINIVKLVDPNLDLSDVSADIICGYELQGLAVNDIVKSMEFSAYKKGMEQGDKFMKIELPFMALDIVSG